MESLSLRKTNPMKKQIYSILIVALLIISSTPILAQTAIKSMGMVSGTIQNDTVWASDTIHVSTNLEIPDSVTLTINPGTVVLLDDVCINAYGRIIALGAPGDSIIFKAADTTGFSAGTMAGWNGITFDITQSTDTSRFSHCVFEYFSGTGDQSAIYTNGYQHLVVENSRFSYNYSGDDASCLHLAYGTSAVVRHNEFFGNESYYSCINVGCGSSGDISNPLIIENYFHHNLGQDEGSSLKLSTHTTAHVINNVFVFNESYNGGAIVISGNGSPKLIGNLIVANHATNNGGAIAVKYETSPDFYNNTIAYNTADNDGGAFSISCDASNITYQNNIIWGNSADEGDQFYYNTGGSNHEFLNNIIDGGLDSMYLSSGAFAGLFMNNSTEDPLFTDPMVGDFTINCASPALNAGSIPGIPMPLTDLNGAPRLNGPAYDLGAFEYLSAAIIVSNPQNVSIAAGNNITFAVSATGATAYQWQVSEDLGTTWVNVTNNATYTGAQTNTLGVFTDYPMNGNMYRCQLEGACSGVYIFSDPAFLFVNYNVGIDETDAIIGVFPNPAKDVVNVANAEGKIFSMIDLNGREVFKVQISQNIESLNISSLESGIYIIRITDESSVQNLRFVKE